MTPTLFISEQIATQFREQIAKRLEAARRPLDVLVFRPDQDYTDAQIESVEAAFYSRDVWQGTVNNELSVAATRFWQVADRAPNLKWVQILAAGTDHDVYQPSLRRGIRITTSSGTNAEPVGLTAVTGLMMLARGFPHWMRAQQEGRWSPIEPPHLPRDLRGQNAVIVGTGHIGTVIARSLQAMEVHTIGVRRRAEDAPYFDEVIQLAALDSALPHCDWLVLACPLTEATRGLMDARRLNMLPQGAGLVNVGRGEVTDESALLAALSSGHLIGAYLDVFHREPLPADSPLWKLPNVLISPHNAAASTGNFQRGVDRFLENLDAYVSDKPLVSLAMP